MRAIAIDRYGGPQVLTLHELPVPQPGPTEVLISVHTAGVGGWDADIRGGWSPGGRVRFPLVLGTDGSGTIAQLGHRVRRFKAGDRVYAYLVEHSQRRLLRRVRGGARGQRCAYPQSATRHQACRRCPGHRTYRAPGNQRPSRRSGWRACHDSWRIRRRWHSRHSIRQSARRKGSSDCCRPGRRGFSESLGRGCGSGRSQR